MIADREGVVELSRLVMQSYVQELVTIDMELVIHMGSTYSKEVWGSDEFLMNLPYKWEYSRIYIGSGQARGALIASAYANRFLHIHRFFVEQEYQNKQIGRELHDSLLAGAKNNCMNAITLFVHSDNTKAICFYEANGYVKLEGDGLAEILRYKGRSHYQQDGFFDENQTRHYAYQLTL